MILPAFYPILDAETANGCAEALLEAGATIIQFRHKGFFSREEFEQAEKIAKLCRAANALLVVNDRADIAKLLDAGLHLGQDDLSPADARRILPVPNIIGFSTHNEQQLIAGNLEPVDYLAIGPIFPTRSKLNADPVVGLDRLRALRKLTPKPLVAIGGITRQLAPQVFQAGADSVAVISDLFPRPEEWIAICAGARAAEK
jgi:thiamine-phosphate pyrophosphorylase